MHALPSIRLSPPSVYLPSPLSPPATISTTGPPPAQAVSLEGWTDQMYMLMSARGNFAVSIAFYVTMVTIGGLFIVQLFLAIIFDNFV